jgi:hypothetical protein
MARCSPPLLNMTASRNVGLVEVAARRDLYLEDARVPWYARAALLEIAAALVRYLERTFDDDRLDRLDAGGIEIAFALEQDLHHDTCCSHAEFVVGAHALQDFAVAHGLMGDPRAAPDARARAVLRGQLRLVRLQTADLPADDDDDDDDGQPPLSEPPRLLEFRSVRPRRQPAPPADADRSAPS